MVKSIKAPAKAMAAPKAIVIQVRLRTKRKDATGSTMKAIRKATLPI